MGLIYGANNIHFIANHPTTEQFVDTIRYNLRALPRVDYTEVVSEEENSEDDGYSSPSEEHSEQDENPEILATGLKRRRDPNVFSRIVEETLG